MGLSQLFLKRSHWAGLHSLKNKLQGFTEGLPCEENLQVLSQWGWPSLKNGI